jgi:hypothetical protein
MFDMSPPLNDVERMTPVSTEPLKFPRWEVPSWNESPDSDRTDEEYFDADGRMVGGVRPFGNKWSAWRFNNTSVTDNTSHVVGVDLGIYYTKEQAKASVVAFSLK